MMEKKTRVTGLLKKVRAQALTKSVIRNHGNLAAVGRELGVTRQTIATNVRKPVVQKSIAILLEKNGVTDNYLAKKIKEGCEATKLVLVDTTEVTPKGQVIKSEETVDDHQNRHKFVVTALQLKGHLKQGDGTNVSVAVGVKVTKDIDPAEFEDMGFADRISSLTNGLSGQRQ